MRICYIIITCEAYLKTRAQYQRNTFLKLVDPKDVFFLSSKMDFQNRVYGWDTTDDYASCPIKYLEFFTNMDLDYDFYLFIDDDTFVFPKRLTNTLLKYDSKESLYIGNSMQQTEMMKIYMSGGAGFLLTKPAYKLVRDFVIKHVRKSFYGPYIPTLKSTWYSDILIGLIVAAINNNPIAFDTTSDDIPANRSIYNSKIQYHFDFPGFGCKHIDDFSLNNMCTFHTVKDESEFAFYNTYL
jgi:hypothetical protein